MIEGEIQADACVVGGGLVGGVAALALAQAGVDTLVVDHAQAADMGAPDQDGRASAVSLGSAQALRALDVWPRMAGDAQAIMDITVTDGDAPGGLRFGADALGHAGESPDPVGYIAQNWAVRRALTAAMDAHPRIKLKLGAGLAADAPIATDASKARLKLSDGVTVQAGLVIGCDGRGSRVRSAMGGRRRIKDYGQTALTCVIRHELPHRSTAHERFLPGGPLAFLPMTSRPDAPHRSSMVWSLPHAEAKELQGFSDDLFAGLVADRFGDYLGRLERGGPLFAYPLSLMTVDRFIFPRVALVGDSAHGMHPIAGQGFNLGLRDAAVLAEAVADAKAGGRDIGGPETLERYVRWRHSDVTSLLGATDILNALFANTIPPVQAARRIGLSLVDRMPPLKRLFMRNAMGVAGDAPKLVRGEALG